jgi:tRNA threonylcarbamoyladenosine biosynthesis protein TsaB
MPALSEILAAHARLLLLDAASSRVQVGLLERDGRTSWAVADEEAGTGLFRCLEQLAIPPADVGAYAFCEGPGSLLGIRTTAMALRTWLTLGTRPVYAFQSLAVVAKASGLRGISVIADARRDSWHCLSVDADGVLQPLRRLPAVALSGRLLMPENFRHWSAPPADRLERTPYDLSLILPAVREADLFRPSEEPDAYLHEDPVYVAWTPQVHRAPAAP